MSRAAWVTTRIDRARRLLRASSPPAAEPASLSDVALTLVRADLERFMTALAASLAPDQPRPDSPARLTAALSLAIAGAGGAGDAEVTRSPAGLRSPECWHVRIAGADGRTREVVARLTTGEAVA